MQAPGGPDEDRTGGFVYGGWVFNYWDELMGKTMDHFMSLPFELLLGRKTYDIFAAYWPTADQDSNVAKPFNTTKKYVVSNNPSLKLPWQNSSLVTGNVAEEIKKMKNKDGPDLWVHGSGQLIQTLLVNNLVDRMHLWIFPVTVGKGKRLFGDGIQAQGFRLVDSKVAKTGVIIATYEPAGPLETGSIGD